MNKTKKKVIATKSARHSDWKSFMCLVRVEFREAFNGASLSMNIFTMIIPIIVIATQWEILVSATNVQTILVVCSITSVYASLTRVQTILVQRGSYDKNRMVFILYNKHIANALKMFIEWITFMIMMLVLFALAFILASLGNKHHIFSSPGSYNTLFTLLPVSIITTSFFYILVNEVSRWVSSLIKVPGLSKLLAFLTTMAMIAPTIIFTYLTLYNNNIQIWIHNNSVLIASIPGLNLITPTIAVAYLTHPTLALVSAIEYFVEFAIIFRFFSYSEKQYLISLS